MISPAEAELLGMHVGDGTLYKTNRSLVWELRGDLKERPYYEFHVAPLLKTIFSLTFIPKYRSGGANGCIGIQTSNKLVTTWFLHQGFLPGKKSHSVRIPRKIRQASTAIQYAFIRGLFDTDGCLRFDISGGKKRYPKLEFTSMSKQLIEDVSDVLHQWGLRYSTWEDTANGSCKLCIAGGSRLEFWMRNVRPGNSKHLNKYVEFQNLP